MGFKREVNGLDEEIIEVSSVRSDREKSVWCLLRAGGDELCL